MNSLLLSEISAENVDLINALLLLEEFVFGSASKNSQVLENCIAHCQQAISTETDPLVKVQKFLETLYVGLLFVDQPTSSWSLSSYRIEHALLQRKIAPALKAILVQEIARGSGLECDVVFVPETLMVRIICNDEYAVVFEPVTGEPIDGQTLDTRITQLEGDPESIVIEGESAKTLLQNYLLNLKNTLIAQKRFQEALCCVDVLLAIKPNDPVERRDRGFLFHQLDCFKVAYDDYRYFVEQCPEDPAAQLLKLQLDNIHITNIVLH